MPQTRQLRYTNTSGLIPGKLDMVITLRLGILSLSSTFGVNKSNRGLVAVEHFSDLFMSRAVGFDVEECNGDEFKEDPILFMTSMMV